MRNASDKPIDVVNAGFWPNHRIDLTYSDGTPVLRTESGQQALDAFLSGKRRKTVLQTLLSGEILTEEHMVSHFQLHPNNAYQLTITYAEGEVVVPSNLTTFVMR
jgi:hypothetical protein